MKRLIALFAGIVAMLAVSCSLIKATPSDVAVDIYELIGEGKYDVAVEKFYIDETDPAKAEKLRSYIISILSEKIAPQIAEKGGLAKVEAINEVLSEDGKSAKVDVKLTYNDGSEDTNNVDMVYTESGEWKASVNK